MTDIVERLRVAKDGDGYWPPILADQAADEIERLRAKIERFRDQHEKDYTEIERLRDEVSLLKANLKDSTRNCREYMVKNERLREALKDA